MTPSTLKMVPKLVEKAVEADGTAALISDTHRTTVTLCQSQRRPWQECAAFGPVCQRNLQQLATGHVTATFGMIRWVLVICPLEGSDNNEHLFLVIIKQTLLEHNLALFFKTVLQGVFCPCGRASCLVLCLCSKAESAKLA